jgi:hypothetical protein
MRAVGPTRVDHIGSRIRAVCETSRPEPHAVANPKLSSSPMPDRGAAFAHARAVLPAGKSVSRTFGRG